MMRRMLLAQQRERVYIVAHMATVKGLMPLLMKRRNGNRWSRSERAALYNQLRALSYLSPYLITLALPGSFLMLPVLAWWLDRRRGQLDGPRGDNRPQAMAAQAEAERPGNS